LGIFNAGKKRGPCICNENQLRAGGGPTSQRDPQHHGPHTKGKHYVSPRTCSNENQSEGGGSGKRVRKFKHKLHLGGNVTSCPWGAEKTTGEKGKGAATAEQTCQSTHYKTGGGRESLTRRKNRGGDGGQVISSKGAKRERREKHHNFAPDLSRKCQGEKTRSG